MKYLSSEKLSLAAIIGVYAFLCSGAQPSFAGTPVEEHALARKVFDRWRNYKRQSASTRHTATPSATATATATTSASAPSSAPAPAPVLQAINGPQIINRELVNTFENKTNCQSIASKPVLPSINVDDVFRKSLAKAVGGGDNTFTYTHNNVTKTYLVSAPMGPSVVNRVRLEDSIFRTQVKKKNNRNIIHFEAMSQYTGQKVWLEFSLIEQTEDDLEKNPSVFDDQNRLKDEVYLNVSASVKEFYDQAVDSTSLYKKYKDDLHMMEVFKPECIEQVFDGDEEAYNKYLHGLKGTLAVAAELQLNPRLKNDDKIKFVQRFYNYSPQTIMKVIEEYGL